MTKQGLGPTRLPSSHRHLQDVDQYTQLDIQTTWDVDFVDWSSGGAAFGPWLVTPDAFLGTARQRLTARVGGRTVYSHAAEPLIERLWRLLAHASSRQVLEPGDVLAVLAPGVPFAGPRPAPGVICEVELPPVGTLRNEVVPAALR